MTLSFHTHLQGDYVWYDNGATGEFDLPAGAVVKQADSGQIVIVTDEGEVRSLDLPF